MVSRHCTSNTSLIIQYSQPYNSYCTLNRTAWPLYWKRCFRISKQGNVICPVLLPLCSICTDETYETCMPPLAALHAMRVFSKDAWMVTCASKWSHSIAWHGMAFKPLSTVLELGECNTSMGWTCPMTGWSDALGIQNTCPCCNHKSGYSLNVTQLLLFIINCLPHLHWCKWDG